MPQPDLLLFNHPVSSYAQKVRIALREKGLSFEAVSPLTSPDGPDPAFVKANPRGEVPVLLVSGDDQNEGGQTYSVVDSRVICEFLDERFPEKPLFPKDVLKRVKARQIEQVMDTQYEAINWGWGEVVWMRRAEGALADHLKDETQRQTKQLQDWLEARIEPSGWLAGPDFSIADAVAAVLVNRSDHFGFGPSPGGKLDTWLKNVRQRPSIQETLKEFDDNVSSMAASSEAFLSGKRKREYRDYRLEFLVKSGGASIVADGLRNDNIRFPWPEGQRST